MVYINNVTYQATTPSAEADVGQVHRLVTTYCRVIPSYARNGWAMAFKSGWYHGMSGLVVFGCESFR